MSYGPRWRNTSLRFKKNSQSGRETTGSGAENQGTRSLFQLQRLVRRPPDVVRPSNRLSLGLLGLDKPLRQDPRGDDLSIDRREGEPVVLVPCHSHLMLKGDLSGFRYPERLFSYG